MSSTSPYILTKELETQLSGLLSSFDIYAMEQLPRKLVTDLRRQLTDARLDVRDYELSETRAEQLKCARTARKRLDQVRKDILLASEQDIFGPVDVAQLTAQLEQIIERVL